MGVNQVAALLVIKQLGVCRVSEVMEGIESNINVTSQLITNLVGKGLVEPVHQDRSIRYQITKKGEKELREIYSTEVLDKSSA